MNISYTITLIIIFIIYLIYNNNLLKKNNICKYENNDIININNNLDKYLSGYWLSENNFLKLSGIDNLILYLDIINNFGYLVIIKNKKIIHNIEFTINYNKKLIKIDNKNPLDNISFDISFNSLDNDFIWKNKIFNAILSISNGNIKLFENNTLFGNLFKENKISYYLNNI